MIQTITFSDFCDAFRNYDRNDQFSYNGKRALYDYLIDYEEQTGEQIELDVIALCCEYGEYDSIEDCIKQYDNIEDRQDLEDHTTVVDCTGGHIIIASF